MPRPSRVAVALGAGLTLLAPAPSRAADHPAGGDPVYDLVGNCYALKAPSGRFVAADATGYAATAAGTEGAEGFRMQATALGRYLLYSRTRDMPAAGDGPLTRTQTPGPTTDFTVRSAGSGRFSLRALDSGKGVTAGEDGKLATGGGEPTAFDLVPATACQAFPEIETNTTGEPSKGKTPYGEVRGWLDSIDHMMAFEFIGGSIHCGRPWSPYGASVALVDCPDHGPNGSGAAVENALSYGDPTHMHTPDGWPSFTGWPTAPSLTHEQVYWKWLERAWRGGERLMGGIAVDNGQLCELYPLKRNPCDEMVVARKQLDDFHELQDYVDAQFGGPGKGFFRIVTTPYEARRVINDGKLAVFLGMELSRPLGCRSLDGKAQCTKEQISSEMDELYGRGLRTMLLVNKFDNALVGVAGDGGPTGAVINSGNRRETGHYWDLETCTGPGADKPQSTTVGTDEANFAQGLEEMVPAGSTSGAVPLYPPAPHCNTRGLTDLGEDVLDQMMNRRMIVDVDHMSVRARNQTLSKLEARRYSGVLSSHGWSTADAFQRIYALGGLVTPYAGNSTSFATEWKRNKGFKSDRFPFGFGIGSDIEGFGSQGNPRPDNASNPVTYPFKGLDPAVTLDRGRSNTRVWDVNTDGVAQYGLYPDWIEDLRKIAGDGIVEDLAHGAEDYLEMWERADGVPAQACLPARIRFTANGLGPFRVGADDVSVLRSAGQPVSRPGQVWTYCGTGRVGRAAGDVKAVLTPEGTLGLVRSTGAEHRLKGVGAGARAARLPRSRRLSATLRSAPAGGGARYVFGVKRGKVTAVGVASATIARSPASLRRYAALAGMR